MSMGYWHYDASFDSETQAIVQHSYQIPRELQAAADTSEEGEKALEEWFENRESLHRRKYGNLFKYPSDGPTSVICPACDARKLEVRTL